MMDYAKFAWGYLLAAQGDEAQDTGKMKLSDLAIAFAVYQRPLRNVVVQWEVDPLSLIEASLQELEAAYAWLEAQIVEDEALEPEIRKSYALMRDWIPEGLQHPRFRWILATEWTELIKGTREHLKLSTDKG